MINWMVLKKLDDACNGPLSDWSLHSDGEKIWLRIVAMCGTQCTLCTPNGDLEFIVDEAMAWLAAQPAAPSFNASDLDPPERT